MIALLFSEPLFKKSIKDEKTETRRVISFEKETFKKHDNIRLVGVGITGATTFEFTETRNGKRDLYTVVKTPRLPKMGLVFFQEPYMLNTWRKVKQKLSYEELENISSDLPQRIIYKYNNPDERLVNMRWITDKGNIKTGYMSKLFCPAKYSRYLAFVWDVQIQRASEIDKEAAIREGFPVMDNFVSQDPVDQFGFYWNHIVGNAKPSKRRINGKTYLIVYPFHKRHYRPLSYQINSKTILPLKEYPNPWVWVYRYAVIEKPQAVNQIDEKASLLADKVCEHFSNKEYAENIRGSIHHQMVHYYKDYGNNI